MVLREDGGQRFAGRELYGSVGGSQLYGWTGTCSGGRPGTESGNFGRPRAFASWSREADDSVLVKTERERKAKPKK